MTLLSTIWKETLNTTETSSNQDDFVSIKDCLHLHKKVMRATKDYIKGVEQSITLTKMKNNDTDYKKEEHGIIPSQSPRKVPRNKEENIEEKKKRKKKSTP
jgi:hypothetical protein